MRLGALVRQVGDLIIVNESIRVVLNFAGVTNPRCTLNDVEKLLMFVKSRPHDLGEADVRPNFHRELLNKYKP